MPVVAAEKKALAKGQARSQSVASDREGPRDPATFAIPSSGPSSPTKGTDDDTVNVDLNQEFLATCSLASKAEGHIDQVPDPLATHEAARPDGPSSKPDASASVHHSRMPSTSALPTPRSLATAVASLRVPLAGQPGNGRWSKVESRDGTFIDCVPMPPPELFQYFAQVHGTPVDAFLNGDGAPYISNSHREALVEADLPIFEPLQTYCVADHPSFDWDCLVGKTTLVLLPDYSPFKDDPPFFSHKTFVNACTSVLKTAKVQSKPTHIYFAYMCRQSPTNERLAPMLDKRIDLIPLAAWCRQIYVFPMICMSKRDSDLRLTPGTVPSPTPMIIQHLFSGVNPGHVPGIASHFLHGDVQENAEFGIVAPQSMLVHVRIDSPRVLPNDDYQVTCALDLIRRLNKLGPDDGSTVLRGMVNPRYPATYIPRPVSSAPDGYAVWDWHVPPDVLMALMADEEELREDEISWSIIDGSERTVTLSHVPAWVKGAPRAPKRQASSIRDSLYTDKSLAGKFASLTFTSKYDVLAQLNEGVNKTVMASQLKNLDNIVMQCPITHKTIAANGKITRVEPPQVIVCYPPSYAPAQVVQLMAAFGPVLSHQPMPVAGQLLVTFSSPASAQWSYGAKLPGRVSATSGDPSADSGFELEYRLRTIRKVYPQLFAAPCVLSLHALAAHDIQGPRPCYPRALVPRP